MIQKSIIHIVRKHKQILLLGIALTVISLFCQSGCGSGESPNNGQPPMAEDSPSYEYKNEEPPADSGPPSYEYEIEEPPSSDPPYGDKNDEPPIADRSPSGDYGYGIADSPIEEEIPKFPWPPPAASTYAEIPSTYFRKSDTEVVVLADVDQGLSEALDTCDYSGKSYFAVPNGFVLVTRLEQIHPDGRSKKPPDRWAEDIGTHREFSLRSYIKALFTAEKGYYRIIAFIVTDQPFTNTGAEVTREEAERWLIEGFNKLPNSIGKRNYTQRYKTWAYVYEFEQPGTGEEVRLNVPGQLPITAKDHMIKAKLWDILKK